MRRICSVTLLVTGEKLYWKSMPQFDHELWPPILLWISHLSFPWIPILCQFPSCLEVSCWCLYFSKFHSLSFVGTKGKQHLCTVLFWKDTCGVMLLGMKLVCHHVSLYFPEQKNWFACPSTFNCLGLFDGCWRSLSSLTTCFGVFGSSFGWTISFSSSNCALTWMWSCWWTLAFLSSLAVIQGNRSF